MGIVQSEEIDVTCLQGPIGPTGPTGADGRDGPTGPTGADLVWSQMTVADQSAMLDAFKTLLDTSAAPTINLHDRVLADDRFRGPDGQSVVGSAGPRGPTGASGSNVLVSALGADEAMILSSACVSNTDIESLVADQLNADPVFSEQINAGISCSGDTCSLPDGTVRFDLGSNALESRASGMCISTDSGGGGDIFCANDDASSSVNQLDVGDEISIREATLADGSTGMQMFRRYNGKSLLEVGPQGDTTVGGNISVTPAVGANESVIKLGKYDMFESAGGGLHVRDNATNKTLVDITSERMLVGGDQLNIQGGYSMSLDKTIGELCISKGAKKLVCVGNSKITVNDMFVIDEAQGVSIVSKIDNVELLSVSNEGVIRISNVVQFPPDAYGQEEVKKVGDAFYVASQTNDPSVAAGEDYIGIKSALLYPTQADLDASENAGLATAGVGDPYIFTIRRPDRSLPGHVVQLGRETKLVVGGYTMSSWVDRGGVVLFRDRGLVGVDSAGNAELYSNQGVLLNVNTAEHVRLGYVTKHGSKVINTVHFRDAIDTTGFDGETGELWLKRNTNDAYNPNKLRPGLQFGTDGLRLAEKTASVAGTAPSVCLYDNTDAEIICDIENLVADVITGGEGGGGAEISFGDDKFVADAVDANEFRIGRAALPDNRFITNNAGTIVVPSHLMVTSNKDSPDPNSPFVSIDLNRYQFIRNEVGRTYPAIQLKNQRGHVVFQFHTLDETLHTDVVGLSGKWKIGDTTETDNKLCFFHWNSGTSTWESKYCFT